METTRKVTVKGWLFSLEDSRGGTVFVGVEDRKNAEADLKEFFEMEAGEELDPSVWGIAPARIKMDNDIPREVDEPTDVEWDLDYKVLAYGQERELFDGSIIELEMVKPGQEPEASQYFHPRWDDDAFSFVFM